MKNRARLHEIAMVAEMTWPNMPQEAVPYLNILKEKNSINEVEARDAVIALLSYANDWKGDVAESLKRDLNQRLWD